jgi:predicted RNase H-like nuclease
MFVGLDGCAKGWVAVRLDDNGTREIDFLTDLKDCLSGSFTRAMIDILIGLPDSDYRNCDLEGRKLLGENRSRLFSGARRPLLHTKSAKTLMPGEKSPTASGSRASFSVCCRRSDKSMNL